VRTTGATLSYGAVWQEERLENEQSGDFGDASLELDRRNVAGFGEVALRPHPRLDVLAGLRALFSDLYDDVKDALLIRVVFAGWSLVSQAIGARMYGQFMT